MQMLEKYSTTTAVSPRILYRSLLRKLHVTRSSNLLQAHPARHN